MKLLKLSTIALSGILLFSACKKKEDKADSVNPLNIDRTDPSKVSATPTTFAKLDPNSVSTKLQIAGSTKGTGKIPGEEDSTYSLIINQYSDSDDIRVPNGSTYTLGFNTSSTIEGIYVQVEGATDYFKIPKVLKSETAFRTNKAKMRTISGKTISSSDNNVEIPIEIPSTITTGTFCVTYCIYANGLYSKPITKCINVQQFGGEGAAFVGPLWKFTTANLYYNKKSNDYIRGLKSKDNLFNDDCNNEESYTKVNSYDFTFKTDGTYTIIEDVESVSYSKNQEGVCTKNEDSDNTTANTNSKWAYNATTKTLTIFYDYADYDSNYWEEYRVTEGNGVLSLSYLENIEELDFSFVLNFKK